MSVCRIFARECQEIVNWGPQSCSTPFNRSLLKVVVLTNKSIFFFEPFYSQPMGVMEGGCHISRPFTPCFIMTEILLGSF